MKNYSHSIAALLIVVSSNFLMAQSPITGTYDAVFCVTRGPEIGRGGIGTFTFSANGKVSATTRDPKYKTSYVWTGDLNATNKSFTLRRRGSIVSGSVVYFNSKSISVKFSEGSSGGVALMTRK